MIGLLLLTHRDVARGLLGAVEHTFGRTPPSLAVFEADYDQKPERMAKALAEAVAGVNDGDGVLILTDLYGCTHANLALPLLRRGHIEMVSGLNLPMLLKVLGHRQEPLDEIMDQALSGGCGGIVFAGAPGTPKEAKG
jgi:PTS system ascorbate-specific IIA component